MAIISTASFLALLEKSQLLGAADLEKVRAVVGKYADAKALALALVTAKGLTRWQAAQLLAGRSSFFLGKYKLLDLLGRGGMGSVFAAEHKTFGRRVAVKIISKQTGRDPEKLEQFLEEARRIAALDHPNIVRAFDVDHEGERYFLVLEYVEGRNLQQIVESDGPLSVERAVRYVRQAALGLAHAHERKMIHCDIKPGNLIVGDDDVVKILDMGMARLVQSDGSSSDSNESIVGTIDYIAPEQALEAEDLDHRVDIYSLGCTLYFLLTSRPPFGEGTLAQRIMKHQTQPPRPISDSRSGVPTELADVCLKMMAKKPDDRFQTALDVAKALDRWAGIEAGAVVGTKAAAGQIGAPVVAVPAEAAPEEQDVPQVKISIVDSDTIRARAGSQRTRRAAAVKKPVAETPEPAKKAGFFADPRKKWASIAVASILLLMLAVGGLVWMLGTGSSKPAGDVAAGPASVPSAPPVAHKPAPKEESAEPVLTGDMADLEGAFGTTGQSAAKETPVEKTPESDAAAATPAEAIEPKNQSAADMPAESGATDSKPEKPEATGKESEPKTPEAVPEPEQKKAAEEKPAEKKPEQSDDAEKKEEPEKAPPKADPFKDFPTAVNIPVLSENDPAGQASKAAMDLGPIHGPADVNWQLLLLGGDKFLKGGRKFVLARTEQDAAKAEWSIQLSSGAADEGEKKLARLWRDGELLKFQWDEKAPGALANYLRNCMLQVRAAGDNRYLALTQPVQAEPVVLDLIRGQGNSNVALKWAPEEELLRIKFDKIEGVEKAEFKPAEPVTPKTPVTLNFVYTDRYKNDTDAVTFRITPRINRSALGMDVKMQDSASRMFKSLVGNFNEQQVGVAVDRMGNMRQELERKWNNQQGEDAQKTSQEIDRISGQIWLLQFFVKAHKKLAVHYQVVTDVGGQELVLARTK